MRDMDPSGHGTPKPDDIPDIMATAAYLDNIRMNPDRCSKSYTFRLNLTNATMVKFFLSLIFIILIQIIIRKAQGVPQ